MMAKLFLWNNIFPGGIAGTGYTIMPNTLIYGTRRQGKSTLALALAVNAHRRVAIFDPNNQFPLVQSVAMDSIGGRFAGRDETLQYDLVRVGPIDTERLQDALSEFAAQLVEIHNVSVIVDEAHMFQGLNSIHPDLDRWQRRSTSELLLIQTTHRLVDATPDSRYHADDVFLFFAEMARERKTIRENYGEAIAFEVARLRKHEVIHWQRQEGGAGKWWVWDDPKEWYIDLENNNS